MSLEEMLLRNELERLESSAGEIDRLLSAIARRLEDARNPSIHPETRLEQAYHAILNCALVALRADNLRPVNGPGKHFYALESLLHTLGVEHKRVDHYQELRDLRNKDIYEGSIHVSQREVEEAIEEAVWLQEQLHEWLAQRRSA